MAARRITTCRRCGECCRNGGPALHRQDLPLVGAGTIPLARLITIRRGEPVVNPKSSGVTAAKVELVKLAGEGRSWHCGYYDSGQGCTIYAARPQACRVLQCWNPEESLALIEKDTLTRKDILPTDSPFLGLIDQHEGICPCAVLEPLIGNGTPRHREMLQQLEQLVNDDLRFRRRVVSRHSLALAEELFYFGRPLFQLLGPFGCRSVERRGGLALHWEKAR